METINNQEIVKNIKKITNTEEIHNLKKEEDSIETKEISLETKENIFKVEKEEKSFINQKRSREDEDNSVSKPKRKYKKRPKEENTNENEKHAFYIKHEVKKGRRIFGCSLCKMYFKSKANKKNKSKCENIMVFHSIKDLKIHFNTFHLSELPEKVSDYTRKQILFNNCMTEEMALLKKEYKEMSKENVKAARGYFDFSKCKKCGYKDKNDKLPEHKLLICNRIRTRYKDIKEKSMMLFLNEYYSNYDRFEMKKISEINLTFYGKEDKK